MIRKFDRQGASRAAAVDRLADAARGGPDEDLTAGLAIFYRAQVHSSPYESTEQQVELPTEALDHFERSALARPPDVFERRLWEEIGRVLVGKRWIEEIYTYVAPVAERNSPWPMLEHVLARADIESLEAESAIARLTKLTQLEPDRFEHWYFLAEAQMQAKRERDAVDAYKRALALQPDNSDIKRKLAVLLLQLGESEGTRLAEELLVEDPDDAELLKLLGREPPSDASSDLDPHEH
jgi:tetratricopeptide (TPR) repeat protein